MTTKGERRRTQTVLLDLDDTLLDNDMQRFLPPYFAALGRRLARWVAPDELMPMLLTSIRAMMANHDPQVTNQQAFNAHFFPALGHSELEMRPIIRAFYEEEFPALREYTRPRPQARPLVEALFERGCQVVVATNPMFPRRAIEHRLDWAGVGDLPFTLITSYENAHFCKPNPRYYQEILEHLDCRPHEAIMIGDDWENDIQPALQVGLHTFWISEGNVDEVAYCGLSGSLAACLEWVRTEANLPGE
jgi:HAD superfamily hydrolase (TIGR01662 family)